MTRSNKMILLGCLLLGMLIGAGSAEDWPTYHHDYHRSAMTAESLPLPLYEGWRYQPLYAPQPAWPEPAGTDYWHRMQNLKARVIYDRAFHPILIGERIFFASSADDRVYCLNALSGEEQWHFDSEGPVRLAPTWHKGRLYFGSDDGYVYCLQADTGELVWKWSRPDPPRLIPGNERIISHRPVRTGLIVENERVLFFTGLFPDEGVDWFELNAADGSVNRRQQNLDISPQGYMWLAKDQLYVPTGRTAPAIFSKNTGEKLGKLKETGGTFALLEDDQPIFVPGKLGEVRADKDFSNPVVTYSGEQVIVHGTISFLRSDSMITAVYRNQFSDIHRDTEKLRKQRGELAEKLWDLLEQRKIRRDSNPEKVDQEIDRTVEKLAELDQALAGQNRSGIKWQRRINDSYAMILAGSVLFLGGDNLVTALSAEDGRVLWKNAIHGKGYGLAAANQRLVVSTDLGTLHGFSFSKIIRPKIIEQKRKPVVLSSTPSSPDYAKIADRLLSESGIRKGYCLVLGNGSAELALALARKSKLKIVGLDDDPARTAAARAFLHPTGLLGKQISVCTGDLRRLPFSHYFANLIVSEQALTRDAIATSPDEVLRVLRPFGGKAVLAFRSGSSDWVEQAKTKGWRVDSGQYQFAVLTRGAVAGGGEWTHLYADAANTSCSKDELRGPVQIQWFGQPGPRDIINRHSRPMSPLFKDGRVFVPANDKIVTVDAYNGASLWEQAVPQSRRLGALKDCGQMAVIDEALYIAAQERCWHITAATGEVIAKYAAPQLIQGQRREWGYLATVGEQLFGSGKRPGASFRELARLNSDELEGDFREMICSDYLFSMNRRNGGLKWTYQNGVMFNNTIAIGDGHLYLIESRNAKARSDNDGRMRVDFFCEGENYLIKLNQSTGEKIWEKAFRFPYSQIMYLSYAQEKLLVVGSYNVGANVHYGLFTFDSRSGDLVWQNSYKGDSIGGEHGEQWQHPVIIGKMIYQRPYAFDLNTGRQANYVLHRGGGGCGGLSGSAHYLYGRGSNPRIYELTEGETSGAPLTQVSRPGCWINIVAAGGLILIPESSSGCTCAYPIQTSIALVPES